MPPEVKLKLNVLFLSEGDDSGVEDSQNSSVSKKS